MAFKKLRIWLGLKQHPDAIPRHARIGRESYGINGRTFLNCTMESPVEIGAFCSIGPGVLLICQANHPTNTASTFPFQSRIFRQVGNLEYLVSKGPIIIGNDV